MSASDNDGKRFASASARAATVLVTGGGGYVASHCVVELLQKGFDVVAIDNFVNSVKGNVKRCGKQRQKHVIMFERKYAIFIVVVVVVVVVVGVGGAAT